MLNRLYPDSGGEMRRRMHVTARIESNGPILYIRGGLGGVLSPAPNSPFRQSDAGMKGGFQRGRPADRTTVHASVIIERMVSPVRVPGRPGGETVSLFMREKRRTRINIYNVSLSSIQVTRSAISRYAEVRREAAARPFVTVHSELRSA